MIDLTRPSSVLRRPAGLLGAIALLWGAQALAGPVAPPTWDTCFSDRNGLNNALREVRTCAGVTASGSYGYGGAGIGNGRAEITTNGTGWADADAEKNGFLNRAMAGTSNGGITWASSDLTTGKLRSASDTNWPIDLIGGVQTFNLARMGDVLTLVNTTGIDQRISFGYAFDGGFVNATGSGDYGYVVMNLGSSSGLRLAESGAFLQGASNLSEFYGNGTFTHTIFNGTDADREVNFFGDPGESLFGGISTIDFILPPGESDFVFGFAMYIQCRSANARCDFGNTSTLSFGDLPQGVSFRSQSGVFLSGVGSVPEPASWALALLPLGLLLARGQRNRR
jgi:hypothetical protein